MLSNKVTLELYINGAAGTAAKILCGSSGSRAAPNVARKDPPFRNSDRKVLSIFISISSLNGTIKKNGMLFDRYDISPSKYAKDTEPKPQDCL